jgi:hypothetical protein
LVPVPEIYIFDKPSETRAFVFFINDIEVCKNQSSSKVLDFMFRCV